MKIALVHDALIIYGGAERIFQYLCEEFEDADIYTLSYNPENTLPFFKTKKINVLRINKWVQYPTAFKFSFPISKYLFGKLDLSKYDLVISSSASIAKYISVPNGKHFNYCYYPTRALWEPKKYFDRSIIRYFIIPFLPYLRKMDKNAAGKIDHVIAISSDSQKHIKRYYDRESFIINCPIDTSKFCASDEREDYYLLVSRLEKWKKIDYAIKAFNTLKLPLRIVGEGKEEAYLKSISNSNIQFVGFVDEKGLSRQYSKAKAVIFTPHLEYGLIPLEANASGTPVIAFGKGGVTETMINYNDTNKKESSKATAVFFYEQTEQALIEAVLKFNKQSFNQDYLVEHAKQWNVPSFQQKIREYIWKNL
jgi:glycosyltransferase involved in cell wall biosynthesis